MQAEGLLVGLPRCLGVARALEIGRRLEARPMKVALAGGNGPGYFSGAEDRWISDYIVGSRSLRAAPKASAARSQGCLRERVPASRSATERIARRRSRSPAKLEATEEKPSSSHTISHRANPFSQRSRRSLPDGVGWTASSTMRSN